MKASSVRFGTKSNTMSSVLFEIKDTVAVITLNRPEKANALNGEMLLLLQQHLDECKQNDAIRAVYITGAGTAFSAGQDLTAAIVPGGATVSQIVSEYYNPTISKIRELNKPVVAAVSGVAAGAGANIALCCDVVVAASSATFIQAFSKIGLIPDSGGTYFLPRLIGWQKASALCMLGDKVSADEAEQMGMIYKVFADDVFVDASFKIAETLAQLPTKALALTKQALNNSFFNNYKDQLHDEGILQERAVKTEDFKEGVQAFLQKRKPLFKGK